MPPDSPFAGTSFRDERLPYPARKSDARRFWHAARGHVADHGARRPSPSACGPSRRFSATPLTAQQWPALRSQVNRGRVVRCAERSGVPRVWIPPRRRRAGAELTTLVWCAGESPLRSTSRELLVAAVADPGVARRQPRSSIVTTKSPKLAPAPCPKIRSLIGIDTLNSGASGCWNGNASRRLNSPCPITTVSI